MLTMADLFVLTYLPLDGKSIHNQMPYGKGLKEDVLAGENLNYVSFIKNMKGASGSRVSYREECCFYFLWICRFLVYTSSKRVTHNDLPIAKALVNGVCVDLSSFVQGELYWAMYLFSTDPK